MKTCPGCGELLGDSVKSCFNCNYNYTLGRIITDEEKEYEKKQQLLEQEEKDRTKKLKQEQRNIQLKNNPLYEYKTVIISNYDDGTLDINEIQSTLDKFSNEGWKLHSILNNELGKVAAGVLIASVNATIDQTVMIFERCIRT